MAARYVHQGHGSRLTIGFGGDISLSGVLDQCLPNSIPDRESEAAAARARQRHPLLQRGMRTAEVWGDCVAMLQADLTLAALASPLTTHQHRARRAGGGARRAHPLNVEVLTDANVDFVALAGEHAMDFQEEGLEDTQAALEAVEIAHAGAGATLASAHLPAILSAVGRKVAVFSISFAGSGIHDAAGRDMWAARARRSGIALYELADDADEALLDLKDAVTNARAANRDPLVVISVCWGRPNARSLDASAAQRSFARSLIEMVGADVVHGHGAGHIQGVELHRGRPIMYSCGTLASEGCVLGGPRDGTRDEVSLFFVLHLNGLNQMEWLQVGCQRCARAPPTRRSPVSTTAAAAP